MNTMGYCATCGRAMSDIRGGRKYCSERCRKAQYGHPCIDCGGPTNGSDGRGPKASTRCNKCNRVHQHEFRHWKPDTIIEALQAWAADIGRTPRAQEGQVAGAPVNTKVCRREFGSWRAALLAAGLQPQGGHARLTDDERAEIVRLYVAGETWSQIADDVGVSLGTVNNVLKATGTLGRREAVK